MRFAIKAISIALALALCSAVLYGAIGYWDAAHQSDEFASRADSLIADGRGPADLGAERLRQLILVQDPGFFDHGGVDVWTNGAGLTTISQSLSKRLGFETFRPGIAKIRQTGFALGLESRLSKEQILALWLDTAEMGRGPNGWMTGFFHASDVIYDRTPETLLDQEYYRFLSVLIAPGKFHLVGEDEALDDRSARIARLVAGECRALNNRDVWLDDCA